MSKNNPFNKKLWELGKETEDTLKPEIDKFFGCDFYRNDDVFDVLDFHDDNNKVIVEVKGRRCSSTAFKETILTVGKITEGLMEVEKGYEVYIFFVFTDITKYVKLEQDNCNWNIKNTGTRFIPHYLIPVSELIEFNRGTPK
jgi:hypothetical protein|tara:strand:- start:750 stop:1175 length:426 start_codon:yes stop_codon:yes gene_type:complete